MNLTTREKYIAITGAAIITLLIAFQMFVNPAISRINTLKRVISEKNQKLTDITAKSQKYNTLSADIENIRVEMSGNSNTENLLPAIEKIQNKCGLKQNIFSMKPSNANIKDIYNESSVEIIMQKITLDQLLEFLNEIESMKSIISIRTLQIKHTPQNPTLLDTTIKLAKVSI
jgi:type II secretory pathway component PulM